MELSQLVGEAEGLLQKSGADLWEVMSVHSKRLNIGVRKGEVDKFQQSSAAGMAIRVIKDKCLGFSYIMGAEPQDLPGAIQEALASAAGSDLVQEAGFVGPASGLAKTDVFDPALSQESVEKKKDRALALAGAALSADPKDRKSVV